MSEAVVESGAILQSNPGIVCENPAILSISKIIELVDGATDTRESIDSKLMEQFVGDVAEVLAGIQTGHQHTFLLRKRYGLLFEQRVSQREYYIGNWAPSSSNPDENKTKSVELITTKAVCTICGKNGIWQLLKRCPICGNSMEDLITYTQIDRNVALPPKLKTVFESLIYQADFELLRATCSCQSCLTTLWATRQFVFTQ